VRTLVIHGESDRLVPPGNARLIAARVPGAKLVMIPHASHIFATDQPGLAHEAILSFLTNQDGRVQTQEASQAVIDPAAAIQS